MCLTKNWQHDLYLEKRKSKESSIKSQRIHRKNKNCSTKIEEVKAKTNSEMSATMRSTLQTVPESLPADHITNSSGTTATTTIPTDTTTTKSSHSHTNTSLKQRSSSTKVSLIQIFLNFILIPLFSLFFGILHFSLIATKFDIKYLNW